MPSFLRILFGFSADLWHVTIDFSLGRLLKYFLGYVVPWVIQPTGEMRDWVRLEESKNNRKLHHSLYPIFTCKNSRRELTGIVWARVRTRLVKENLFLENSSLWNGYTQACIDPNRSRHPSFPSACEQIKYWHQPKRFGAKSKQNLHGNCQKKHSSWYTTANRQRQHCWQMQVKQRQWKGKIMMENSKVSPNGWRKQASDHRVPTAVSEGQSFKPFQDSKFTTLCSCCPAIKPQDHWFPPAAAFWLGLIAHIAVLWLCRWDRRIGRSWVKSTVHLMNWDTQQGSNTDNYSFLSFLP